MVDIYDDLDNYLEVHTSEQLLSENKELKIKLEENSVTLNKLKEDFDRLSAEHQLLLKNFSTLLKTAKAELQRKTQTIMQINIEKDELFLQLASSRFNGKKPMSQKNVINEHFGSKNTKTPASPVNDVPDAKDVVKKEIVGSRNKQYETRQHKNKMVKSNQEVQNTSNENVVTNEVKESCRGKENHLKADTPVAKVGSMIDTRLPNTSKITSDEEEGEISDDSIDLRNKLKKLRSHESTHPFAHTKEDARETRSNKHVRNKEYEIKERDLYRYKDKIKERSDSERQYRSRAQEKDFSNKKDYQRGRSRHRVVDSPSDRYYRDKSRGWREHKQDRYVNEPERVNEKKHKASDADSCEPSKKRRRHSMYEGPEEVRSRRQSEHFEVMDSVDKPRVVVRPEGTKGSILGERLDAMTCQSPDDPFAERNVPPQPLKLISQTATTKLDDPRQSSRRYIQIQDRDNKPCLVAARATNVHLMKVPPWIVVDSKPADEDKVREIYADIDKQINNMSIEADKSSERKDKIKEKQEKSEVIVDCIDLGRIPNNNETIVSKEDDVKQANKSLIDSPVPIKKYKIPKRTSSTEKTNVIKENVLTIPLKPSLEMKASNTFDEPILSKPDKQVSKNKYDKQEHKEQIETKSNENTISSYTKNKPEMCTKIKQSSEEHGTNVVHEKIQPETSKPEPCNPLQTLFNHLKLAQANSQTKEPNPSNKNEISNKASADTPLNHAESKITTNDTITVHKSIVEGDLELSDETSDFTQFNEKYSQKIETPKKKKTKKVTTNKDVKVLDEPKKKSETDIDKKTLEMKAKFSDLFGDTSCSLITPEDLNLPRPKLENYPCIPSMESANEPWSLQYSPWKPEIGNPESKTDKTTEDAQVKEEAIKRKPDDTSIVKTCDKSKEDKLLCERDLKPDKTVSTPLSLKANITIPNVLESQKTDFQANYKTSIKALATSTPLRPNDKISNQSKITASSLSMIPEISSSTFPETSQITESSLSKIPEETTDLLKDMSMSDSSKSHAAVDIDTPDVRIVIKRKKRVIKK